MVIRNRFLTAMVVVACISGVQVTWNSVSAETGDRALRFDLQPSGFELAAGVRRIAYSEGDPLVVLLYSDSPDAWNARSWRMVGPDSPVVNRDGKRLVLTIPSFGGLAVKGEVSCEVDEAHGELQWTMNLRNDAIGTVVGVIGPCLRNVQDGPDGFLAVPNRPGHRIRDPWKTLAASVQHLEYPVPASMQYMAYSSSTGGVAVHALDPGMVYKQLAFGGPGRQMTFIQYPFLEHGAQWTSPPVLWQVFSQDWHQAADRYRQWFRSWAAKPQVSSRVRGMPSVPGIVIRSRPKDDEHLRDVLKSMEVGTYEAGLPKVREYAKSGFNGVHLVGWFGQGHDTTYPDHEPASEMGGEPGLLRLAEELRTNHLLAVYYINARLLNVTSTSYRSHPDWAALTQDGPRREQLSTEVFHVACPASPGFQRHLEDEVLRVAGRYGGDGVQLDQIGAAWSVLCFDKSHGHRTPATAWAEGYTALLSQLRSAVRKVNPEFFCWVEGAWEGSAQYVDLSQGGFWPDHPGSEPFPEMYHYTLPEHPLFGDPRLGGVPYWCPSDIARARRINAQASPFFWDGEFQDTLNLSTDQGGEVHWFRKGSEALITVFNPLDGAREFNIRFGGTLVDQDRQHLTAMALTSGTATPATLDGNSIRLKVNVPPRQVEAVLLKAD